MARFLWLQYKNTNINLNNNPCDKKGDKNRKKGDKAKLEDKDNNNTGTAGAHVGETAAYILRRPNPAFKDNELFVDVASDTIQDDGLYKFMDNYNKWDNLPNTAGVDNDTGSSHTFTAVNTSGSAKESIKLCSGIGKRHS